MNLPPGRLSRRRLLVLLGVGAIASCSPANPVTVPEGAPRGSASTLERLLGVPESELPRALEALPSIPPYQPSRGDVLPAAKRVAGDLAQRLTSDRPVRLPRLARAAAEQLRAGGPSVGEVITVQLGGLSPDERAASMMVVLRHHEATPEGVRRVTRTIDMRVRRARSAWVVDEIASTGGAPPAAPAPLSAAARAVLDSPRITLPDSARWDVERGAIEERLLRTMLEMAQVVPYAVTAMASGHPFHVFATRTVSNHSVGRAIDVATVDGVPVVAQHRRGSPAFRLARVLFDRGIPELGAPWDFDAPGSRRSFTNLVHADHLHVGFEAPPRPPSLR